MKVSRFPPLTKHYKVHHNIKQLFYRDPARPNNSFSLWNVLERFCHKEQEFFILLVSVRLESEAVSKIGQTWFSQETLINNVRLDGEGTQKINWKI